MSPVSKEKIKKVAEYNLKVYDRIEFKVKKGEKAELQAYVAARGESMNAFINRAIKETQERDQQAKKP